MLATITSVGVVLVGARKMVSISLTKHLTPKVESLDIDAMDISPDNVGKFDVVMFLGVLSSSRPNGWSTSSC